MLSRRVTDACVSVRPAFSPRRTEDRRPSSVIATTIDARAVPGFAPMAIVAVGRSADVQPSASDECCLAVDDHLRRVDVALAAAVGVRRLACRERRARERVAPAVMIPVVDVLTERDDVDARHGDLRRQIHQERVGRRATRAAFGREELHDDGHGRRRRRPEPVEGRRVSRHRGKSDRASAETSGHESACQVLRDTQRLRPHRYRRIFLPAYKPLRPSSLVALPLPAFQPSRLPAFSFLPTPAFQVPSEGPS
jgi:hypothetical protein